MCCYRNRCVFQTLLLRRQHQLFRRVCFEKWCNRTAVVSIANTDNKHGRLDSIALAVSKGVYRIALVCCPNLQRITQRFDSTTFQKETGEATAHTAPALAIHWTSSFKYIPYRRVLLVSIPMTLSPPLERIQCMCVCVYSKLEYV